MAQQASIGSTIEVIVGRNDTLDAIFRRMALDTADLAAIRQLPGIRQSLDFLKPGDAIKVTHNDGETPLVQLENVVQVAANDLGGPHPGLNHHIVLTEDLARHEIELNLTRCL